MSEFDWRSPTAYKKMQNAESADFAWEYLRRNSDYRQDYRNQQNVGFGSIVAADPTFRQRWGFLFAADPDQAFDAQAIFWAPEMLPTVLRVGSGRAAAYWRPYDVDVGELSGADLRRASDGWHAVFRLGGATHRLWLQGLPAKSAPLILELPLDTDFDLQSRAAYRLWSAIGKRTLAGSHSSLPLQRRQRLTLAIRALDGRIEGNSYRTIAVGLFGANRIPEWSWKTHDLRNRTIRLVQTGLSLMRGGYRTLLRHRHGAMESTLRAE
jgi:type VI secretion system activator RovC-like protein/transcriptional regulator